MVRSVEVANSRGIYLEESGVSPLKFEFESRDA